jgi:DNA polymerase III sliding clamp (beta) subunit (PCNA family)
MPAKILLNDACIKCLMTARDNEDVTISVAHNAIKKQETFDAHTPASRTVDYLLDQVSIKLDHSRFKFDVRCYEVPTPHTVSWDSYVEFQRADFERMVRLLGGVSDENNSDHNMTGICLSLGDEVGMVHASATDGRRVGRGLFPAAFSGPFVEGVIPRSLIRIAKSIDSDDSVLVTFSERSCFIRIGDVTCEGVLTEGRFPPISGLLARMDSEGAHVGDIKREDLVYGLRMSAITTNRQLDAVGVVVESTAKGIRFRSEAPDRGKSCTVTHNGLKNDFSIMIDPTFLIPPLAALSDDLVSVHVIGDQSLQVSNDRFRFLVAGIIK